MKQNSLKITLIPILTDNYVFLLQDLIQGSTAVVDPGEAEPVIRYLARHGLTLDKILLTHHHGDHIGGVHRLTQEYKAQVIGPKYDHHRIPHMQTMVQEGDTVSVGTSRFEIWYLPGHTLGHIAYVNEEVIFSGDVLFGMGCGRLFEGTAKQMHESLQRIRMLPPSTKIYCTHEYTQRNAAFAATFIPHNIAILERQQLVDRLRSEGEPTVPLLLSEELATNPFFLAKDLEEFSNFRNLRNNF